MAVERSVARRQLFSHGLRRSTKYLMALALVLASTIVVASVSFNQKPTPTAKKPPCAEAPDELFTMFVPLGHARYFGDGQLMLNNRGIVATSVTPRWYVQGRTAVAGVAITLPPSRMDFYSLQDFLPPGVSLEHVTGLELSYVAKAREIWAQVILRPLKSSQVTQSLDSPFTMRTDFRSQRLEAAIPAGLGVSRMILSLANTSDEPIEVTVSGLVGSHSLRLAPKSGEVWNRPLNGPAAESAGVRISASGRPGAVRALGFLFVDRGTPLLARFYDPAAALQEDLYAAGVPVENTTISVSLANTSPDVLQATPQVLDSETGRVLMSYGSVQLAKGTATVISPDLRILPEGVKRVTLKIDGTGSPGSLVGTLHVANAENNLTSEIPLRDIGGMRASTGGYPWRLDGDYQTKVYIANVGAIPARFTARLQLGDVKYILKTKLVPVGASETFDIRQLRDSQTPDAFGTLIPIDATSGQFYWSAVNPTAAVHFAGRAEITSKLDAVASTFSCMMCCPESVIGADLTIADSPIETDDETQLFPMLHFMDCYESTYWDFGAPDGFGGYDGDVVSVDSDTYVATGVGEGSTSIHAYFSGAQYVLVQPEYYEENDHCDASSTYPEAEVGIEVTAGACSVPKNFKVKFWDDIGNGVLFFEYKWESTSNNIMDLDPCSIREYLTYETSQNPWQFPAPFPAASYPNPWGSSPVNGRDTPMPDYHIPGGNSTFRPPYAPGKQFIVTQRYQYSCPCKAQGAWQTMKGPHPILRKIESNGAGGWKYSVTKTDFEGHLRSAVINSLPGGELMAFFRNLWAVAKAQAVQ